MLISKFDLYKSEWLELVFDNRNKEYGAYELRKSYNARLRNALIGTALVVALLFVGYYVSSMGGGPKKKAMVVQDVELETVKDKKDEPPPPPPPKVERTLQTGLLSSPRLSKFEIVN